MLGQRDLERILSPLERSVLIVARTVPAGPGRWREVARQVRWAGGYDVSEIGCEDAAGRAKVKIERAVAAQAKEEAPRPYKRKAEAPAFRVPQRSKTMKAQAGVQEMGAMAKIAGALTGSGDGSETGPYSAMSPEAAKAAEARAEMRARQREEEDALRQRQEAERAAEDAEEGFAERITRETREEADRVCRELARLRFDARQVQRVLKALGLNVPYEIEWAASDRTVIMTGMSVTPVAPERAPAGAPAPEATEEAAGSSPEPATAEKPSTEPEPVAAGKPPKERPAAGGKPRQSPTHPVTPGDWPDDLKMMPAAQKSGGPITQRRKAAEKQLAVYREVEAHPTRIPSEVAKATGLTGAAAADALRELQRASLILRTGKNRREPGKNVGRASVEYRPLVRLREDAEKAPAPAAPPRTEVKLAEVPRATRMAVDDFIAKRGVGGQFTLTEVIMAFPGASEAILKSAVDRLVGQEKLARDGQTYAVLVCADLDAPKKRGSGPRLAGQGVAGTGKKGSLTIQNPELRKLVTEAERAGAKVSRTANGHLQYVLPGGKTVFGASTPRGSSSIQDDRAKLKREGLAV
jgi:hypothetical protein